MKEFLLKDIKFQDGQNIIDWDHIIIEDCVLFYKPSEYGFKFYSIENSSYIGENENLYALHPENCVNSLFWGWAFFDGIRHLYFGNDKTENTGYINYPNIERLSLILQELRKLEIKFCRDPYYN